MVDIIDVGLPVALLGVVVVFFMLSVLILIIKFLIFADEKIQFGKNVTNNQTEPPKNSEDKNNNNINKQINNSADSTASVQAIPIEHIVVITAAIAASLGSNVRIKSIKECTGQNYNESWALSSRLQRRQLQ